MPPSTPPNRLAAAHEDAFEEWLLKLGRLVTFTRQLSAGFYREFGQAFDDRAGQARLPEDTRSKLLEFRQQLDDLERRLEDAESTLIEMRAAQGSPQAKVPGRAVHDGLVVLARGLEATAWALREDTSLQWLQVHNAAVTRHPGAAPTSASAPGGAPSKPRPGPGLASGTPSAPAAKPGAKGVTGLLSRWMQYGESLAREPEPEPQPEVIDPLVERRRQAFEATLQLAAQIMAYVAPRLTLVKTVAGVLRLPGTPPPWLAIAHGMPAAAAAEELPASLHEWLLPLARLFLENRRAARDAQVAVVQWQQAKPRLVMAESMRDGIANAPPDRYAHLVETADPGPLRAAVLPLNHLHLTFRDVPLMRDLFPSPAGQPVSAGFSRGG
jgi:hypothetical protein